MELVPLRHIDERLPTCDDWQVLHGLHVHERPWDGLITTDHDMLSLPKELAVLCQSRLSLVIAVAAGHDPIKATGLVLAHISGICSQTRPKIPQIWRLRTTAKPPEDPWDFITKIASRQGATVPPYMSVSGSLHPSSTAIRSPDMRFSAVGRPPALAVS